MAQVMAQATQSTIPAVMPLATPLKRETTDNTVFASLNFIDAGLGNQRSPGNHQFHKLDEDLLQGNE